MFTVLKKYPYEMYLLPIWIDMPSWKNNDEMKKLGGSDMQENWNFQLNP